jgi:glycosyltransferase involved in cell wall biosynthesis
VRIAVIIPAKDEAASIGKVIDEIPKEWVQEIVVANNGSKDATAEIARRHGATVVDQPAPGYGHACLAALAYLARREAEVVPDVVVFLDGDYSDYPEELPLVVRPILTEEVDLVIGSRVLGRRERGSMQPQQLFGNWLATWLIRWLFGHRFTDLGPFRAIRWDRLQSLGMADRNYGWTVEMQVKAAKRGLACREVPVNYRRRIGVSKVSGTISGSIRAGYKILWTIFRYC